MRRPTVPLQWALFVSHVALFCLPVALAGGTGALARDQDHQRRKELAREASLLQVLVEDRLAFSGGTGPDASLDVVLKSAFERTGVGVRVVDASGVVVASSGPRKGEKLADRPEIEGALRGEPVTLTRLEKPPSRAQGPGTPQKDRAWSFASRPLHLDGRVVGAVVAIHANRNGWDVIEGVGDEVGWGAVGLGASAILSALYVGWRVSRSLRALARVAHAAGEGAAVPELDAIARTRVAEVRGVAVAFRDMLARLRERLRYNEEFAANVSHEFKTPLTTLRGTMELLADDEAMEPDQRRRFLANARTDLDRLLRLVQGLLDLARAEARAGHERVALGPLLEALETRFSNIKVHGVGGVIVGDRAQVELAVANLVENAIQHGGPRVEVEGVVEPGWVGVRVWDDGPGIPPANLPHLFDRFFTTSPDRRGTGLGLPLVRAVAAAHGGEATVESSPGRTCFTLRFPTAE
jgi:signal transduction histidine kinase